MRAMMTIGPTNDKDCVGRHEVTRIFAGTIARRMARKDRVPNPPKRPQGPQRRSTPADPAAAEQRRKLLFLIVSGALALAAAVAAVVVLTGGGSGDERSALEDAGCTLKVVPGVEGEHTAAIDANSNPKWNTDPPTSGPHNEQPAVWGSYEDPVALAQTTHNLEHGGIVIHYGKDVPSAEVDAIRSFYDEDPNGMVVSPLPKLGNKIALSAWTTAREGDLKGQGFLATCPGFDEDAFSAFVDEHRFKGPERFPPELLTPGS